MYAFDKISSARHRVVLQTAKGNAHRPAEVLRDRIFPTIELLTGLVTLELLSFGVLVRPKCVSEKEIQYLGAEAKQGPQRGGHRPAREDPRSR